MRNSRFPFAFIALFPLVACATEPPRTAERARYLRPLHVSADLRIVDDLDREVLLRGANVNSLGEYWQGDPNAPSAPEFSDDE